MAVVLGLLSVVLAACGSSKTHPSAVVDDLRRDFAKVLTTRVTALEDLRTVSAAVTAVQQADDATSRGTTVDEELITTSVNQSAQAAPIVARTRSDVASYQNALASLEQDARNPKTSLDDEQRAKIAALCTTGRAEAEAIKGTATAYATEWPAYSGLAQALQTWLQRSQHGQYVTTDDAQLGYRDLTTQFEADLAIGRASAAAAETTRNAASKEMATAIGTVQAEVPALENVPLPAPSEATSSPRS